MHLPITLLSLLGAAVALPPDPRSMRCNHPDSNCEYVVKNGYKTTQFKEGTGPGSEHYKRTFGEGDELSQRLRRRDDGIESTLTIGKTEMSYGCNDEAINIYDTLYDAIGTLCGWSGSCDKGSEKKYDSGWVDGDSRVSGDLVITTDGTYPPDHAADFKDAVTQIPVSHATTTSEKQYFIFAAIPYEEHCQDVRMANYGAVVMFDGMNQIGDLSFKASIEADDPTETCELVNGILGAVSGAVNGIAGGFFGLVNAICSSAEPDVGG